MDIAILIQGPNTHPKEIKKCYYGLPVIFSTLKDSETDSLLDSGFNIIKNEIPMDSGKKNFNYQIINTLNGIKKAKDLGFNYVLKIRSDITIPEISKLLNLMGKPKNEIYFSAYHSWDGGYLCEHMIYGNVNLMEKLWNIPFSTSDLAPEIQLTNHFLNVLPNTKVKYIFPLLYKNNILAFWEKRKFYLNEYEKDKLFKYDKFI
jgi:hypothetical protein